MIGEVSESKYCRRALTGHPPPRKCARDRLEEVGSIDSFGTLRAFKYGVSCKEAEGCMGSKVFELKPMIFRDLLREMTNICSQTLMDQTIKYK